MKQVWIHALFCAAAFISCGKGSDSPNPPTPPDTTGNNNTAAFAKGADISWLTEMEASGYKFYNRAGQQKDCYAILKEQGMNTIRLRAWVNPTNGWCNTKDVLAKAKRAKAKAA